MSAAVAERAYLAEPLAVGLKMRLQVDAVAAEVLDEQSRIHAFWHNYLVARVNELREHRDEPDVRALLYSTYGLRNLLTAAKIEHVFLAKCWTYSLQCVAARLTRTINRTRSAVRSTDGPAGPWAGWPRFHRWSSHWASLEYHVLNGGFVCSGRELELRFGRGAEPGRNRARVRLAQSLPDFARVPDAIRGLRIIKEHGVYSAVFTVRRRVVAPKPLPERPRIISLDPHHYNLAVGVDTEGTAIRIGYPRNLRACDRRIDQLRSRRDHCVRTATVDAHGVKRYLPSRRWTQFHRLLQAAEQLRQDTAQHALYTIANQLYAQYDVVAIGDYSPAPDTRLPSAITRWTFNNSLVGALRQTTAWMATRSGKAYLTWPEAGTTRTCHRCGYVWPEGIPTRLRYYRCPHCGQQWRRNENNALNGLDAALRQLGLPTPSPPVARRLVWRWRPEGVQVSPGAPVL